jgi:predicted amidohydrolase
VTRANNLVVVAAQSTAIRGDLDENIAGHLRLIRVAASFGADLVVFPELSLTGYELDLGRELQLDPDDPKLEPLRNAVREHGVHVVVGGPWRSGLEKPWLGAFLISPERSLGYAKIHVHESEDAFFAAGKDGCVVSVRGVRVGIAICADTNFPVHADDAAANGADIYIASVMKTEEKYPGHAEKLKDHAVRHGMAVLTANYAGSTGNQTAAGKSAIRDERGHLVAQAEATGEALVFARRTNGKWHGAVYKGPEFSEMRSKGTAR